jgi:hypothetical protein
VSVESAIALAAGVTVVLTFAGGLTVKLLSMFIDARIDRRTDPMVHTLDVLVTKIDNGILHRLKRLEKNLDTMYTRIVGVPPPPAEPPDGVD